MDLPLILLLEGVLFIVVFQGMSLLRQEGFSNQSALEVLGLTVLFAGVSWLAGLAVHPVLMLVVIYLVSMRTRILVDFGNLLAHQGRFSQAEKLYAWACRLWPDAAGKEIVQLNRATNLLFQGQYQEAASAFTNILERAKTNRLGDKYRAAAHYNLGVVFRKQGNEVQARSEFNEVVNIMPISEYARMARAALKK